MPDYSIRPARAEDLPTIRGIINQVRINPLGLHWERFSLAVETTGEIIGCGQIKVHGDRSHELASIAVIDSWRNQGVASAIIRHLLEGETEPLFLTCRRGLKPFYQRFGFREALPAELTPYFRRLRRLVGLLRTLQLMPSEGLLIMLWEG